MREALKTLSGDGERPVTIELKLNDLEPGEEGLPVARAEVKRRGRLFTVVTAEVVLERRGESVAEAMGTFTTVREVNDRDLRDTADGRRVGVRPPSGVRQDGQRRSTRAVARPGLKITRKAD